VQAVEHADTGPHAPGSAYDVSGLVGLSTSAPRLAYPREMHPPPVRYLDREGASLAYQVVSDGPVAAIACMEAIQHLDLSWMDPDQHHNIERSARFCQFVMMQRRGVGLSDRLSYVPTLEQQADDILAVMDAVGIRKATLSALLGTCGPAALVAAKAPERVHALVLVNPLAQGVPADAAPHGWSRAETKAWRDEVQRIIDHWGSGAIIDLWDRAQGSAHNRRLAGMLERSSMTPAEAQAYFDWVSGLDIRDVLRSVQVETRVLYLESSSFPEAAVRHVAELIPGATFHVLPPPPPGSSIGQAFVPVLEHCEEVVTGSLHSVEADRFLGTVLFTDVVGSTELLADVGDAGYQSLRSSHERQLRLAVAEADGELVKVTGDGTLSLFDGPTKAVRCAERICREAKAAGISVRCGVHTGELQRDGLDITGMTVHIGARVGAAAGPGEVLVSRTVRDLVVGSGLDFDSRGEHRLKGVPDAWELFAIAKAGKQEGTVPVEPSLQTPVDSMVIRSARAAPRLSRAALRLANAVERRRARVGQD
jgi:class 3 adenylate cyclase/pimeloyl-ACP methyl ester carboxylesterase